MRIRCEARIALSAMAIGELRRLGFADIARRLEAGELTFAQINRSRLPAAVRARFDRYDGTTIGYSFNFNMSESENATASVGVLFPLVRAPVVLGAAATGNLERQNVRAFRVIDTWERLLTTPRMDERCREYGDSAVNAVYPITGQIGMLEQLKLFFDLTESGNLVSSDSLIPTLIDTVQFTTKISGSINGGVQLARLGNSAQFASASGSADASRSDIHKVTIAIALPPENAPLDRTIAEQQIVRDLSRQEELQALAGLRR
ncbi:hypothetical protein C6569_07665 [Phreatobacter cathodiphilus]|uniref:Uncharacterized protein n=2 Tax=Phreatobacter cathodiphilus TaxID=1868589 RepID=A0A2S0N9X5_9HYPH|nr:hypothetical protein C6569_07665 [Phreatobacter cathodiphilus]